MKEVTRPLKDTDNLALAVRTFCKQGSEYFMGISSFSSLRKKYACLCLFAMTWFASVFRAEWSWLGFIKAFLRRSPGEIPKSFCGRRSRDLCEMLCEWGCVMRAEAEGLLIIVIALMCRMSLAIP